MSTEADKKIQIGLVLFISIAFAVWLPWFAESVESAGWRIPADSILSDYVTGLFWATAIWISILVWPIPRKDRAILMRLWVVRCLITLGFMLYYESHYPLDAFYYFRMGKLSTVDTRYMGVGNGTANLIGFVWFFNHYLSGVSYHATKVVISLFGFIGVYVFYRGLVTYLGYEKEKLLYILQLFPSILFWSSILGKDPINIFAICVYLYGVLGYLKTGRLKYLVPMGIGLYIVSLVRLWGVPILLFPFVIINILKLRGTFMKVVITLLLLFLSYHALQFLSSTFAIADTESLLEQANHHSRAWERGGSAQDAPEFNQIGDMAAFAPVGMFTALFRPLPLEVNNFFGVLSGLENLLILYLFVMGFVRSRFNAFSEPIVLWTVCFLLVWSMVYGFVSYQNLGAAVRFRLQVLPAMLALSLYLSFEREKCVE